MLLTSTYPHIYATHTCTHIHSHAHTHTRTQTRRVGQKIRAHHPHCSIHKQTHTRTHTVMYICRPHTYTHIRSYPTHPKHIFHTPLHTRTLTLSYHVHSHAHLTHPTTDWHPRPLDQRLFPTRADVKRKLQTPNWGRGLLLTHPPTHASHLIIRPCLPTNPPTHMFAQKFRRWTCGRAQRPRMSTLFFSSLTSASYLHR